MEFDSPTLLEIYDAIGDDTRELGDDPDRAWEIIDRSSPRDISIVRKVLSMGLPESEARWYFLNILE